MPGKSAECRVAEKFSTPGSVENFFISPAFHVQERNRRCAAWNVFSPAAEGKGKGEKEEKDERGKKKKSH